MVIRPSCRLEREVPCIGSFKYFWHTIISTIALFTTFQNGQHGFTNIDINKIDAHHQIVKITVPVLLKVVLISTVSHIIILL